MKKEVKKVEVNEEVKDIEATLNVNETTEILRVLEALNTHTAVFELKKEGLHYRGMDSGQVCMLDMTASVEKATGETNFAVEVIPFKSALNCFKDYTVNLKVLQNTIVIEKDKERFSLARVSEEAQKVETPKIGEPVFSAEVKREDLRNAIKNSIKLGISSLTLANREAFTVEAIERTISYNKPVKLETNVKNKLGKAFGTFRTDYLDIITKPLHGIKLELSDDKPIHLTGSTGNGRIAEFWMAPIMNTRYGNSEDSEDEESEDEIEDAIKEDVE